MKKKYLVFSALLILIIIGLLTAFFYQNVQLRQKETIKTLVLDAVSLIEDRGEEAFFELRQENSKWFYDDIYVFVWKSNGLRLVYPPDASGEGQNMSSLVDLNGKPIGQLFIDIAVSNVREGWVDYFWPKPGETHPSSKLTFIKGVEVGGEVLVVGSGYYVD